MIRAFKRLSCVAAAGALTLAFGVAAAQTPPSAAEGRTYLRTPGRENTPNGGRPEIHTAEEMRRIAGFQSEGGRAYSELAAEIGGRLWGVPLFYHCKNTSGDTSIPAPTPKPVQVFDNVYSVGTEGNNLWVIKTSDGLILIDALTNEQEVRDNIVAGFAALGLDLADIKYVLITHNHGDHIGGVPYLRTAAPNARVGVGLLDWAPGINRAGDFIITDGMKITLGDTTVVSALTGGHTPATVSLVFPVFDNGVKHVAATFGGQGHPRRDIQALLNFRQSINHFTDFTDLYQADVVLSNHEVGDDGLTKLDQISRFGRRPNPFLVGRDGVLRWEGFMRACLSADIAERVSEGMTYDPLAVGAPSVPAPVPPIPAPARR